MAPNIASATMKLVPAAALKTAFEKRRGGTIGSSARRSWTKNTASRTAPAAKSPRISPRPPGVLRPAPRDREREAPGAGREQGRAEDVDPVRDAAGRLLEHDGDHGEGDSADRDVHVEDPAPREAVDEEPAEQPARPRSRRRTRPPGSPDSGH